MPTELTSIDLEHVHGGASRANRNTQDATLLQLQQLSSILKEDPRKTGFLQPPGANHRIEYPDGFRPNGDARSWRTIDNATGKMISSGTNPE